MIECPEPQRISAYYDGELAEPSRAGLEAHLRGCPRCAAELSRLQKMSQLIRAAGRAEMPREALERLHRSVDLQPKTAVLHMAEVFVGVAASILLVSCIWLWKISTARDTAVQIPLWETTAVAAHDTSAIATHEQQLAQWIVQDLSRKNGND